MTASSKLWLRSLTIHRYEQFRDCPRVEFSPDDNLILGVNGSGKTSLLRLLAAVLRWNYDALLRDPFDIEFEQNLDIAPGRAISIKGRVQYQPARLETEQQSQVRRSARSKYDGFEAYFEIRRAMDFPFVAEVSDSRLRVIRKDLPEVDGALVGAWLVETLCMDTGIDLGLADLHERTNGTFFVRETENDFVQLTKNIKYEFKVERNGRYPVFSVSSEPEDRQWDSLVSKVIMKAAMQQDDQAYLPPVICKPGGGEFGVDMSSVLTTLGVESMSFRLKIEQSSRADANAWREGVGVEIGVSFPSGNEFIDVRLTFGQKRFITIALGALLCGGSPLLVDEIDNGLHPGLVEKTLELIRGRQTFIASHNKLVVDLLDYESPEDMRRTIHVCRRESDGTQRLIELSHDQVREVFEKIEVGIMHPSDVLLQEGLW